MLRQTAAAVATEIADFRPGRDRLDFSDFDDILGRADLRIRDKGAVSVILYGEGDRLVLDDTDKADLGRDDFLFAPG